MCTSIVVNRKKTLVGWNLDLLDMEYRVRPAEEGVYIEVNDAKEGWLPLFGANNRGDFVGMPTCWPFDDRSDPIGEGENVIMLDIDLLLKNKTLQEIRKIALDTPVFSVPGLTFMSALSDREGNVLHIVPGQGVNYYERPDHTILTNFSPFKQDSEIHPWMGWDRYHKAEEMLEEAGDDFGVSDCFEVLKAVSQEVCPTVCSMVFDVGENTVYWCENRHWDEIEKAELNSDRIEMKLTELQPSQFYISEKKLRDIESRFDPADLSGFQPIPVKLLDGRYVMTDGHTRAVAALRAGRDSVPLIPDEDELDWDMYRECVKACMERDILSPADLLKRIICEEDYKEKWDGWCDEMQSEVLRNRK